MAKGQAPCHSAQGNGGVQLWQNPKPDAMDLGLEGGGEQSLQTA